MKRGDNVSRLQNYSKLDSPSINRNDLSIPDKF